VVGSSIAREVNGGVYLHAGAEIGVASTKAFTAQVTVLTLLAVYLGRMRHLSYHAGARILEELQKMPDVLVITGDHSTPCALKGHSWHPQPVLIHSATSGSDKLERFTETGANSGSLGVFYAKFLIRLMQANAKMFDKFGA